MCTVLRTRTPALRIADAEELKTLVRNLLVKQVNTRLAPKLHTDGRPPYASVSNFPYVCNCLITYPDFLHFKA